MRTANPVLSDRAFSGVRTLPGADVMTIEGTVNKSLISVGLTAFAAYWSYTNPSLGVLTLPLIIGTLAIAIVLMFKQQWAPALTPAYAVMEGLILGVISHLAGAHSSGIVFQAISLTFGTLFCLLVAYRSGYIRASEKFKMGVAAATGAIFLVYLASFVVSLFGSSGFSFLHSSSPLSIGISLFVVAVAAANLILDFDFIENAARAGNVPKYMEWYGAFGLLVTLVWLYLEILRLLTKLQSSRD